MTRIKENPRYNVISMRINEKELRCLENLMKKTHQNVSHIMREAIDFFAANYKHTKLKRKAAGACLTYLP